MVRTRKNIRNFAAATVALSFAAGLGTLVPAESAPSYDGLWSVVITTQKGSCERAYRYPIRISNGAVLNDGGSLVTITGKIAPNGAVTVRVSSGNKSAVGSGRLHGSAGAGSWNGGECSGTWLAQRRQA